jgi:hypothetical protein
MSPESSHALAEIRRLKTAMRAKRKELFQQPWSIEVQEQIDDLEVSYYTERMAILNNLSPCRAATVIRHLRVR